MSRTYLHSDYWVSCKNGFKFYLQVKTVERKKGRKEDPVGNGYFPGYVQNTRMFRRLDTNVKPDMLLGELLFKFKRRIAKKERSMTD